MLTFIICLLITVIIHELSHMLTALYFGIKIKAFSVGFFKPYYKKTIKNIEFRISPWLLGGYVDMAGMDSNKKSTDFLSHRYLHKFIVLIAGVTANLLLACICYLIHFGSISFGFQIDWLFLKLMLTKNYITLNYLLEILPINFFLLQLSILNLFCGVTNLIPVPGLDGSYLWIYLMEKVWKEKFGYYFKFITYSGYAFLILLQIYLIWWLYSK